MAARFRVLDNGTLREIKNLFVMQAGVLRRIRTLKVMDGDELRTVGVFAPPLSLSFAGITSGTGTSPGAITVGPVTAQPSGGLAPFAYSWTKLSGSGALASTNTASTAFTFSGGAPGQIYTGSFRCTVTDAVGQTAQRDVQINFIYRDF